MPRTVESALRSRAEWLDLAERQAVSLSIGGASSGVLVEGPMSSGRNAQPGPRLPRIGVRASTLLLFLGLCGVLLRLVGGADAVYHFSPMAWLVLAGMAPAWALAGSLLASFYLVIGMWKPYNAVQHLLEMALGIALTVLMLPVF
jgi:hypothetical protein